MRFLEELSMNALPSLQTVIYDGWVIKLADGFTNRANSINPIYKSFENINEKIEKCETIFKSRNLRTTYKITPFVYPDNLDKLLEIRGYETIRESSVQTSDLSNITKPNIESFITEFYYNDTWYDGYCKINQLDNNNRKIYKKMMRNVIHYSFYTSLVKNEEVIACGRGVVENDYFGLYDIAVKEEYRNCGYGTQLLRKMLIIGKEQGAKKVYLQVMLNNNPAFNLYRKVGFKEAYKYHYRVKEV